MKRTTRSVFTKRHRNNRGNMLSMVLMVAGILITLSLVGYGFYMLWSEQKRGQSQADTLAMRSVPVINRANYVGQMNYMVARSRELVYMSRLMSNRTLERDMAFCAPLADQLMRESTGSAEDLDRERLNFSKRIRLELRSVIDEYNLKASDKPIFSIPGFQSYQPKVMELSLGSVKGVNSNVFHNEIFPELRMEDEKAKYIELHTNLYKGNINARLPAPDQALDFKLCSLPASVSSTVAPARLVNPDFFVPGCVVYEDATFFENKLDQLPSALAVREDFNVSTANDKKKILVAAFAATEGGAAPPEQQAPGAAKETKDSNSSVR